MTRVTALTIVAAAAFTAALACKARVADQPRSAVFEAEPEGTGDAAQASGPFTVEDLIDLAMKRKLYTLDALLPELPIAFRTRYTLMYSSRSSQEASLSEGKQPIASGNPRVIMFGTDAKLLIAFNGDPKQSAYNQLEMIQFREATARFEFATLAFSNDGSTPPVPALNPSECEACHSPNAAMGLRPNWSSYPSWPGSYGEGDDSMLHPDFMAAGLFDDYKSFRTARATHPRYKHLVFDESKPTFPYTDVAKDDRYQSRPNLILTMLLARLQAKRIATYVRAQPKFAGVARPFLASLLDCPPSDYKQARPDSAAFYRLLGLQLSDVHLDFGEPGRDKVGGFFHEGEVVLNTLIAAELRDKYMAIPDVRPLMWSARGAAQIYSFKDGPRNLDPTERALSDSILKEIDSVGLTLDLRHEQGSEEQYEVNRKKVAAVCAALLKP